MSSLPANQPNRTSTDFARETESTIWERTIRLAGVGVWQLDLRNGVLTWSTETRRIHEVPSDYQPTLKATFSFYAADARAMVERAVDTAITDGASWDLELPITTATGKATWIRTQGEAEREGSRIVRLAGSIQDIGERRRLEQRVADSERFLRQVTDMLPVRLAYVDKDQRYQFANLAQCHRFALAREQILGRTHHELVGISDADISQHARAALDGHVQRFEFSETVGNSVRRVECHMIPDVDASGLVSGFFSSGVDITKHNAAEPAQRELTMIFDNTPDFVVQTDRHGELVYMNPSARRAVGMTINEPLNHRQFTEFFNAETQVLLSQTIVPAANRGAIWLGETNVTLPGRGDVPTSHMVIAHRDSKGTVDRYSAVMRDISAQVLAQKEVTRQTDILRYVTESIPTTVVVVNADGRYRFVNNAFEHYCGLPREQIIGRRATEVLGAAEVERRRPWMQRALEGETVSFTLDYPGPDGPTYLALTCIPLRLDTGVVDGFVGLSQDITQQRREEARLVQLAQRDALTGLLNRAGFERGLELLQERSEANSGVALLYIDLDDFKPINDRHGHPAGDLVLATIAKRLTMLVRPSDMVARLGGDEFAIALGGLREVANAEAVADKVLTAAKMPIPHGELMLNVGASVGVAFSNEPMPDWNNLLGKADAALLRAKMSGKGQRSSAPPLALAETPRSQF
jgi:diguanylate cyclase (GGDEF)-like protein/PAS domain S-box-containing protein